MLQVIKSFVYPAVTIGRNNTLESGSTLFGSHCYNKYTDIEYKLIAPNHEMSWTLNFMWYNLILNMRSIKTNEKQKDITLHVNNICCTGARTKKGIICIIFLFGCFTFWTTTADGLLKTMTIHKSQDIFFIYSNE